ncbi:MAG: Na+/H+ antiporter NhaA [Actinobacteria bacterium HGW-Actinobacteria-2]|nr:MAG: Na+/H+ antiporter NhaA [Actinobacteria bacterium HGW-Actinobacteria-2]
MVSDSPTTLGRGAYREFLHVREVLRRESVGGILLILGAALAMVTANLAPEFYLELRHLHLGGVIGPIDLNLSLAHWAADGLLAIFFFLVGLELKHEFVVGDLRDPKTALVPVVAAIGGVALPAAIYFAATYSNAEARVGWAIPAATDIAFALAVLAVIGSSLPAALRTFLLTLAVADDLIAITIIAVFYAHDVKPLFFIGGLAVVAVFGVLAYRGQAFFLRRPWVNWILLPLALIAWALIYSSGVHATVAGVLLGFAVPARPPRGSDFTRSLSDDLEHRLRPFSASIAVPVFAFFAAGVTISGWDGFVAAVASPIGIGVIAGLVLGKAVGISGATWLVTRLRHASLDPDLAWIDVIGLAILGGIGFTVSLLVSELSFGQGSAADNVGKVSVLTASLLAAGLAALVLGLRNRHYREVAAAEEADSDADGIPDKFDH